MNTDINKNWSQTNYPDIDLTDAQHLANNLWLQDKLTNANKVCVPELGMCWDRDMNKTKMYDNNKKEK